MYNVHLLAFVLYWALCILNFLFSFGVPLTQLNRILLLLRTRDFNTRQCSRDVSRSTQLGTENWKWIPTRETAEEEKNTGREEEREQKIRTNEMKEKKNNNKTQNAIACETFWGFTNVSA